MPLQVARNLRKRLTPQEARLWLRLRELKPQGLHFRKQVPVDRYVVDFACLSRKLVVEIDGERHGYDRGRERDAIRDARLAELGFRVLRFGNHDVNREIQMVVDTIFAHAGLGERAPVATAVKPHPSAALPRPPSPAGEGWEPVPESPMQAEPGATPSPAGEGVARKGDGWGLERSDPSGLKP